MCSQTIMIHTEKKESEVAITPNAPIKADWDPAEQRVLSKTDEL